MEANTEQMTADLKAVPAHNLPMEQQVDYHFPLHQKHFWGTIFLYSSPILVMKIIMTMI